jgi:ferredoxin-NADP reductase
VLIWIVLSAFIALALATLWLTASGLSESWRSWRIRRAAVPLTLRVAARTELSDDTFSLSLEPMQFWRRLLAFLPGQHVVLHIPAENGKTTLRAYSLSAWDKRPSRYHLGIKREAEGLVSRWLHEHARPGLLLPVTAPKGSFHSGDIQPSSEVALIAGGIGITPMRAMLQGWAQAASPPRVALHFSARTREQLYYHDEFEALAAACEWFSYQPRLTQNSTDWTGVVGRLTANDVLSLISHRERAEIFICANQAMEDAIIAALLSDALNAQQIHRESFGLVASRNDIQAQISFGGKTFAYDGAPTLLHALLDQDFDIPAECRAGDCGNCRLAIARGTARDLISGKEETSTVLTCCAVPVTDLELRIPAQL